MTGIKKQELQELIKGLEIIRNNVTKGGYYE